MFAVGDVVVCVDDKPYRNPDDGYWPIREGAFYRISEVEFHPIEGWGVNLDIDPPEIRATGMWFANRFRKLPKADDEFTERMRALRPRVPEPV